MSGLVGQGQPRRWAVLRVVMWVVSFLGGFVIMLQLRTVIVLNASASVPYGFYRLHHVPAALRVNQLVVVHVEDWSDTRVPLLKPVAAVAGERICRYGHELMIHGKSYGPVLEMWRGFHLPSAVPSDGCLQVPEGQVFLASAAPRSKDSRYFGTVAITQVRAVATPLWTLDWITGE